MVYECHPPREQHAPPNTLLDQSFKPWLLEVNSLPSLGAGGAVDIAVDTLMLGHLLELLGLAGQQPVTGAGGGRTGEREDVPALLVGVASSGFEAVPLG